VGAFVKTLSSTTFINKVVPLFSLARKLRPKLINKIDYWDRIYKTPFQPKAFGINFRPQVMDKFPPKTTNINLHVYVFWTIIFDFKVF
jgi:hypothetical protein